MRMRSRYWKLRNLDASLTCFGINLATLNLAGFLFALSLLSSLMASANTSAAAAQSAAGAVVSKTPWFEKINISEKTKPLASLFVTEGGIHRHLTVIEWMHWKQRATIWFQDIGFCSFIDFIEDLLHLREDGTFAPLFEDAAPLDQILKNSDLQRHVFVTLAQHAWNIPDLPPAEVIQECSAAEIHYQFKALSCILYKIFSALCACSIADSGTGHSMYSEIFAAKQGQLMMGSTSHNC